MAKLTITDHADPSVGLFQNTYNIDAPIEKEDIEILEWFRRMMIALYSEFATGKVTAEYDFEAIKDAEEWEAFLNSGRHE